MVARPSVTNFYNDGYCDIDSQYVNPINLLSVRNPYIEESIRRKRSYESYNEIEYRDKDDKVQKVARITCKSNAKCIKIKCLIPNLDANKTAVVRISSRIWNATFYEDFNHYSKVEITSTGRIMLDPLYNIIQNEKDDVYSIVTYAYPQEIGKAGGASFWWYFIAIIIGLILLSFLICLLYKCGFFTREKPTDGYSPVDPNDSNRID